MRAYHAAYAKLSSNFGLKWSSASKSGNKSSGSDCARDQNLSIKTTQAAPQLATYFAPGSANVVVSGSVNMLKTVACLQPGDKILLTDVATDNTFVWATLQCNEVVSDASMLQNTLILGLGGVMDQESSTVALKADQVVLAKDRKNKPVMKKVRELAIGLDSVITFDMDDLQWWGKKKEKVKKTSSVKLVHEKGTSERLYKLTVGSTNHSLLMSCTQDAYCFLAIDSSNSTVNLKVVAERRGGDKAPESKVDIENTFITVKGELEEEREIARNGLHGGIPRSYSDTDVNWLAAKLEMDEEQLSSSLKLTSSDSRTSDSHSSFAMKSEMSSSSGGSMRQVRLGTQPHLDENGRQKTTGTNMVLLTDFSNLSVNELGVRLPAASSNHSPGRRSNCHKCKDYTSFSFKKGKVCKNGAFCDFCHEPHHRFIHRR